MIPELEELGETYNITRFFFIIFRIQIPAIRLLLGETPKLKTHKNVLIKYKT